MARKIVEAISQKGASIANPNITSKENSMRTAMKSDLSESSTSPTNSNASFRVSPKVTPSVGGKQIRFIGENDDEDSSSSESYASIESSDDDNDDEDDKKTNSNSSSTVANNNNNNIVNNKSDSSTTKEMTKVPPLANTKTLDIENYEMSQHVQEGLMALVGPEKLRWDKGVESAEFRQRLKSGNAVRHRASTKKSSSSTTKSFARNLSSSLEAAVKSPPVSSSKKRKSSNTSTNNASDSKRSRSNDEGHKIGRRGGATTSTSSSTSSGGTYDYAAVDISTLRKEADLLMKNARDLKHKGDKYNSSSDLKSRGIAYLKSSVKFFEYSLVCEHIKNAYKARNDASNARKFANTTINVLSSTNSLVEAASRAFVKAKETTLMALSYKFAAISHMYIFRVNRVKLGAIHNQLNEAAKAARVLGIPSRGSSNTTTTITNTSSSPDPGCSPPIGPGSPPPGVTPNHTPIKASSSSSSSVVPSGVDINNNNVASASYEYYMKETANLYKAFELWQRYMRFDSSVLPRISDLATAQPDQVVLELENELNNMG